MNILRPNQLAKKLGMSLPTLWRRVKHDTDFPRPVKMSSGITGFIEAESDAYIELKVGEYRANPYKRKSASTAAAVSVEMRVKKKREGIAATKNRRHQSKESST